MLDDLSSLVIAFFSSHELKRKARITMKTKDIDLLHMTMEISGAVYRVRCNVLIAITIYE